MIETIYEELKRLGAVSNRTDFSQTWLGMDGSYFRGKRVRERAPSPKALATCAARLRKRASLLKASSYPAFWVRADQLDNLAEQCVDGMLAACDFKEAVNAHR